MTKIQSHENLKETNKCRGGKKTLESKKNLREEEKVERNKRRKGRRRRERFASELEWRGVQCGVYWRSIN